MTNEHLLPNQLKFAQFWKLLCESSFFFRHGNKFFSSSSADLSPQEDDRILGLTDEYCDQYVVEDVERRLFVNRPQ